MRTWPRNTPNKRPRTCLRSNEVDGLKDAVVEDNEQNAEKVLQRRSRITQRLDAVETTEGKVPIRSHVIEASGSSEAWYVPPRPVARCGLAGRPF